MKRLLNFSALALLVGLAIVVAGCGTQKQTTEKIKEVKQQAQEKKANVFEKAKKKTFAEALKAKTPFKCVVKDDESEVVTYLKGSDFRSEVNADGDKMITVKKGGVIYTWSEKDKEGAKIDLQCLEEFNKGMEEMESQLAELNKAFDAFTPQALEGKVEDGEGSASCEPVMGIDLTVPKDVKFVDQCEMLKNLSKMQTGAAPQNANGPVAIPLNIPGN